MTVNQQEVVDFYNANETSTIPEVATQFSLKPTDVAAILRLAGVKIRRGNRKGFSAEAIGRSVITRRTRAQRKQVEALLEQMTHEELVALIHSVGNETQVVITNDD